MKHGARHIKFGMEADHDYTYKLRTKYCLRVKNYENANIRNVVVTSNKFNI
jgi:hypothetical protein